MRIYFLLCLLAVVSIANAATPKTTRVYDKSGNYAGRIVTNGKETKFYGPSGTNTGRATTFGDRTKFFTPSGTLKGSARK